MIFPFHRNQILYHVSFMDFITISKTYNLKNIYMRQKNLRFPLQLNFILKQGDGEPELYLSYT